MVPTVAVSVDVLESDGLAVVGATVTAQMSGYDTYLNQVVDRILESTVTDVNGHAVLNLFPNVLGARGTAYAFEVKHPSGRRILKTVAQVPNQACNLSAIAGNTGVPPPSFTPIANLVGVGLVSKLAAASFGLVVLTGTANQLNVANGDGVAGNPTISIPANPIIPGLIQNTMLIAGAAAALTSLGPPTNGQLLVGSTGAPPVLATLTGTTNQVSVANGIGSITLSTPQNIHTGATPQFAGMTLTGLLTSTLTSGVIFVNSSGGTNGQYMRMNNTGGDAILGVESSAGGAVIAGTSAYSTVVSYKTGRMLEFGATSSVVRISDTGLGILKTPTVALDVLGAALISSTLTTTGTSVVLGNAAGSVVTAGSAAGGNNFLYEQSSGGKIGFWAGGARNIAADGQISIVTGNLFDGATFGAEQVRINHTASATNYLTLTGSNGGNPTIGASNNSLAVSANTVITGFISAAPSGTAPDTAYNGNFISTKPAASAQHINIVRAGSKVWSIGFSYNTNDFAIGGGNATESNFTAAAAALILVSATNTVNVPNSLVAGSSSLTATRPIHVYGANGVGFTGVRIQNDNANVGLAGVEFSSDVTYSKSAIALTRSSSNGQGSLVVYNRQSNDAANWASTDEVARWTGGGYFKASNDGTYFSSGGSAHELRQNLTGTEIAEITHSHATNPIGIVIRYPNAAPNGTGNVFLECDDSGTLRASIRSNGGLANFSANNVNLSDRTMKNVLGVPGEQRALFRALEIETGGYIGGADHDLMFFTAQQVQTVYPELVTPFDSQGKLGIREHGIQMRAYKVIQELDADLIHLSSRVVELERRVLQ